MATIWSTDAEDPTDLTAWTWTGVTGGCTLANSNVSPIHGLRSYLVSWSANGYGEMKYEGSARNSVYYRYYLLLSTGFHIQNDAEFRHLRLRTTGDTDIIWMQIHDDGVNASHLEVHGLINGDADYTFGVATDVLTPGTAQCIEIYYVKSATVGGVQVWVDGVEVVSNLVQNTDANQVGRYSIGLSGTSTDYPTAGDWMRIDDVVVADAYVGPIAAGGSIVPQAMMHYMRMRNR